MAAAKDKPVVEEDVVEETESEPVDLSGVDTTTPSGAGVAAAAEVSDEEKAAAYQAAKRKARWG